MKVALDCDQRWSYVSTAWGSATTVLVTWVRIKTCSVRENN